MLTASRTAGHRPDADSRKTPPRSPTSRADGWVGALPAPVRPYLLLARLDRPTGIWLLFLPGAWGILLARAPWHETLRLLALFALGAAVMRAAGCVVNDMWDRDLDRQVSRTAGRPLASGALRHAPGGGVPGGLLLAGPCVLLQLNGRRRRWAPARCCWWRSIRWPSASPGGRSW